MVIIGAAGRHGSRADRGPRDVGQPPERKTRPEWLAELEFRAFYSFADNSGGVAIVDPTTLARSTAPWMPRLRFTATPIVPVPDTIEIRGQAVAPRDSVRD